MLQGPFNAEHRAGRHCDVPPHRWYIEAHYNPEGSTETWTCSRCQLERTVQRQRLAATERKLFAVGSANKRPAPTPADPATINSGASNEA